mmetsp:Transcript_25793/g.56093  ORF Transcript_25793/g.56093 Transcript_25793/m.56093 type:complete len:252 (+) Transcript_25793:1343-2098(+)
MSTNNHGLLPRWDRSWNVGAHDRFMEHGSIQDVSDGAARSRPQLSQVEFEHPVLVWCDSCALHANIVLLDCFGSICHYLIVGLVSVGDAQVVVVHFHVDIGEDQFLLDHLPHHPCHLVSIKFDDREANVDFGEVEACLHSPMFQWWCASLLLALGEIGVVHLQLCYRLPLQQFAKLRHERQVASHPIRVVPQAHLVTADRGHGLFDNLWHLLVRELHVSETGIVQHPHGLCQLFSAYEVVPIDVHNGEQCF